MNALSLGPAFSLTLPCRNAEYARRARDALDLRSLALLQALRVFVGAFLLGYRISTRADRSTAPGSARTARCSVCLTAPTTGRFPRPECQQIACTSADHILRCSGITRCRPAAEPCTASQLDIGSIVEKFNRPLNRTYRSTITTAYFRLRSQPLFCNLCDRFVSVIGKTSQYIPWNFRIKSYSFTNSRLKINR